MQDYVIYEIHEMFKVSWIEWISQTREDVETQIKFVMDRRAYEERKKAEAAEKAKNGTNHQNPLFPYFGGPQP